MKNFTRFSILALVLAVLAGNAFATDFNAQAVVEIVAGVDITENAALDFGILAARDGVVTVDANGDYTDPNAMMYDNTSVAAANFSIQSSDGANLTANAVDGGGGNGLTLAHFTLQWDNTANGAGYNFGATTNTGFLEVGANLTVDETAAEAANIVGAGSQSVPWTLRVVFQ